MNYLKIDINKIYIFFCIFLIIYFLSNFHLGSIFYDSLYEVILLNLIFIFFVINSNKKNVFFKIFLFYIFVFYIFNIFTFNFLKYPSYFLENDNSIFKINNSLQILLLHLITLYLFLKIFFRKNIDIYTTDKIQFSNVLSLVLVVGIAHAMNLTVIYLISKEILTSSIFHIFAVIFSPDKILTVLISLLFVSWNCIGKNLKLFIILIILSCLLYDFLSSSKSSIFQLGLVLIICFFCFYEKIILNFKLISTLILLFFTGFIAFFFANNQFLVMTFDSFDKIIGHITHLFHRIGYLDFFLEKVNGYRYDELFSLSYNMKAFVDKITPGFDPYGIPLMKNQLHFLQRYYEGINYTGTVSEQSTIFAIAHRIFGIFYFVYYFVILLIFKFIYERNYFIDYEKNFIIRIFLILLFISWLNGFGIDQFLMLSVYYFIFIILLFVFSKLISPIFKKYDLSSSRIK